MARNSKSQRQAPAESGSLKDPVSSSRAMRWRREFESLCCPALVSLGVAPSLVPHGLGSRAGRAIADSMISRGEARPPSRLRSLALSRGEKQATIRCQMLIDAAGTGSEGASAPVTSWGSLMCSLRPPSSSGCDTSRYTLAHHATEGMHSLALEVTQCHRKSDSMPRKPPPMDPAAPTRGSCQSEGLRGEPMASLSSPE